MRISWAMGSSAPGATVLVRLLVGVVFLSEGIQKFLFPTTLGIGRFIKIGIPAPQFLAPFVGVVEIVCGTLLIIGLLTRLAAFILLIDITVAILTTKVPMLAKVGFWATMHEARTDICMWLGSLFLLIVGAGPWSVDARVLRSKVPGRL
jgi:putative oxidoreductase